jgi:hypothetical protein
MTQEGAVVAPTGIGPGVRRQRTTAVSTFFSGDMLMTPTQYQTVLDFKNTTLLMGSQPFDWTHPLTGAAVSMVFDTTQQDNLVITSVVRADLFQVHMAFEILP